MLNRKCLIAVVALAWPALLMAEIAYVTDILRLGLHRAEDTSDQPFRTLVSGAELEVLARTTNYAQVRAADGQEGWVKSAYLVLDKPAQLRVAETEAELAGLRGEVDRAKIAQRAAEQQLNQVTHQIDAAASSSNAVEATLSRLKAENADFAQRLERYRGSVPISWALGALVVTLITGFALGLAWMDYTSRRRHGGFRIY